MGVLYPGSLIAVVSGTAEQATLIVKKIQDYFVQNPEILREIHAEGHRPVQLSRNKGICSLKNGSKIESYSIGTMRGNRAKIVVIDETPEVKQNDLDAIIGPVKNTKRDICHQIGVEDYPSKTVCITSACLKSNAFYSAFVSALREAARGNSAFFACALDYRSAARVGITDMDYFMAERKKMPESKFDMEYGSLFVGAEGGSVFPYDLTETCRVLKNIEYAMPRRGTSDYVMGVDLATSSSQSADNAVITVLKLVEMENGGYIKKLVYIRSYHGKRLDALAEEVRRTAARFPGLIKVVFDHVGLGDAFPLFLSQPWTDPDTGKEHPPWVTDDERSIIHNAVPMLRSVKGNMTVNGQLATTLRVALEQRSIEMPVSSRSISSSGVITEYTDDGEESGRSRTLTMQEKAIFLEADALQVEMGNIIVKVSASGSYLYDSAKANQHKDRYSSLAMAVRFVAELEDKRKREVSGRDMFSCVGLITSVMPRR